MKTLLVHFARFGPYHYARLSAAAEVLRPLGWRVLGLQSADSDLTYAWTKSDWHNSDPPVITAVSGQEHENISTSNFSRCLSLLLRDNSPDAVAIAGWSGKDSRVLLSWCRTHRVTTILMSETRECDAPRSWWKELIKRLIVGRFDYALVGGQSHRDYLVKLGFPAERVAYGYNVVDNSYYRDQACCWRDRSFVGASVCNPYILSSSRFVARKNLVRLISAFASIVQSGIPRFPGGTKIDLCLLGDGPERESILSVCHGLGLSVVRAAPWEENSNNTLDFSGPRVFLPGFRQVEELPRFYASAFCFVHPAVSEPWGLVINEAMSCGLPVLCSSNCGAAEELIVDGVNGYLFDPLDTASLVYSLERLVSLAPDVRAEMGAASYCAIDRICPTEAFGTGLRDLLCQRFRV